MLLMRACTPLHSAPQVDDALEAVTESNPKPTRFLRKDPARLQPAQTEAPEGAEQASSSSRVRACSTRGVQGVCGVHLVLTCSAVQAAPRAAASAGIDVWDLVDPDDILSKLAKRDGEKAPFLQAVVSEKWKGAHAESVN
jgi:hypothetical protein